MRAKRSSRCTVCSSPIRPGDEIGAFLGKWVHTSCKEADIARRAKAAGAPTEVPQTVFGNETVTYVGTRHWRRKGLRIPRDRDRL